MTTTGLNQLLLAAAAVIALLASGPAAQQPARSLDPERLRAAIAGSLTSAPFGFERLQPPIQAGVQIRSVEVDESRAGRRRITVDLSQKALTYDPSGQVEALLDDIIGATAQLTVGPGTIEYRFLIDGLPLDQFLARSQARPLASGAGDPWRRAVISAGHGWYWNAVAGDWRLQRDYFWGIVEDFVNWEIARVAIEAMAGGFFEAYPARHPDHFSAPGLSGRPMWQEGATYHIRASGFPPSVWDIGVDDYARDINVRPLYANAIDAAVIVSIHNNGGGGTGTETWFDTTNGFERESERLAETMNRHVVSAIRAQYDPAWVDRGLRSCNGCKGENWIASRPAIILEVAFMDMRSPDNAALHDERFTRIVGRAIRDALHEWIGAAEGS